MLNINTHITVNDTGFNLEEHRFNIDNYIYSVGMRRYDSTCMNRPTNDFGYEGNKTIVPSDNEQFIQVGDYELLEHSSTNELGEVEDYLQLRFKADINKYEIETPFNSFPRPHQLILYPGPEGIDGYEDSDKYIVYDANLSLKSVYKQDSYSEVTHSGIGLADWENNQYGRMDKIFDITPMPPDSDSNEESYSNSSKGRFKIGIKNGDTCCYLIDCLNNMVYKKDIYLSDKLDQVNINWLNQYGHQLPFDSTGGESYASPTTGQTYTIKKMEDYPHLTYRAGGKVKQKDNQEAGVFMTTLDFGEPGDAGYTNFTLGPIQYQNGNPFASSLVPHMDYDCLAFVGIHNMYNPSEAKAIIGSTWTCIKKHWNDYLVSSGYVAGNNLSQYRWIADSNVRPYEVFLNTDTGWYSSNPVGANHWPVITYTGNKNIHHYKRQDNVTQDEPYKYAYSIGKAWPFVQNQGTNSSVAGYGLQNFDWFGGGQSGSWMLVFSQPTFKNFKPFKIWKYSAKDKPLNQRTESDKGTVYLSSPRISNKATNWWDWSYAYQTVLNPSEATIHRISGAEGNYFAQDPVLFKGTHSTLNNSANLIVSGNTFVAGQFATDFGRYKVHNITDGSAGYIKNNSTTIVIGQLEGGTDNDWDIGDEYEVRYANPEDYLLDPNGVNLRREVRFLVGYNPVSGGWASQSYDCQKGRSISGSNTEVNLGLNCDFDGDVRLLHHIDSVTNTYDYTSGTSQQTYMFWFNGKFVRDAGSIIIDTNADGDRCFYVKREADVTDYKGNALVTTHRSSYGWGGDISYTGGWWWHTLWQSPPLDWGYAGLYTDTLEDKGIWTDSNLQTANQVLPTGTNNDMYHLLLQVCKQKGHIGYDIRKAIPERSILSDSYNVPTENLIKDFIGDWTTNAGLGASEYKGLPSIMLLDGYRGIDQENYKYIDCEIVRNVNGKDYLVTTQVNDNYGRKDDSNYNDDVGLYDYNFQNEHTNLNMRKLYSVDKGANEPHTRLNLYDLTEIEEYRIYHSFSRSVRYTGANPITLDINNKEPLYLESTGYPNMSGPTNQATRQAYFGMINKISFINFGAEKIGIKLTLTNEIPTAVQVDDNPWIDNIVTVSTGTRDKTKTSFRITLTSYGVYKANTEDIDIYFPFIRTAMTRWDYAVHRASLIKSISEDRERGRVYNWSQYCTNTETQEVTGNRTLVCSGLGDTICTITSRENSPHYKVAQSELTPGQFFNTLKSGNSYESSSTDTAKPERYCIDEDADYITQDGDNYVYI